MKIKAETNRTASAAKYFLGRRTHATKSETRVPANQVALDHDAMTIARRPIEKIHFSSGPERPESSQIWRLAITYTKIATAMLPSECMSSYGEKQKDEALIAIGFGIWKNS